MKFKPNLTWIIPAILLILAATKYFYQALIINPFEIDQEYLALEAWNFLKAGKFTLVGAHTSVGDIYIGPFYTYFVTAVMWLTQLNPWSINLLSAVWAILAVTSLYFISLKLFSRTVGFIAGMLAATSISYLNLTEVPPIVIPLGLVSLLTFYCLSQTHLQPRMFLWAITLAGIGPHLHFTGLYLLAFIIFWIFTMKIKISPADWLKATGILLVFFSPLILFDLRHNFLNSRHFITFLLTTNGLRVILETLWRSTQLGLSDLGALFSNFQVHNLLFGSIATIGFLIYFIKLKSKTTYHKLLLTWLLFPIVINGLYVGGLLPYYYIFHHTQIFLVLGLLLQKLAENQWGVTALLTLALLSAFLNFSWLLSRGRGFNLTNKMAAFEFVKIEASDTNVNLSFTVDHARRGGLEFLRLYYGFDDRLDPARTTYTLVSPHGWQRLKADATFGEIDIILPQKP